MLIDPLTDVEREAVKDIAGMCTEITRREGQRLFYILFPDENTDTPEWAREMIDNDTIFARRLYRKHMAFFEAGATIPERCFRAANRVGKALRNGTPVATPGGWRSIEDLKVGDQIIAGDGSVTIVTGVYPQGLKQLYRITFDVGEYIDCCGEHLWKYQHPRSRYPYRQSHGKRQDNPFYGQWSVGSTKQIIDQVGSSPIARMRPVIPTSQPWQISAQSVPLDPYLVGVLLGDGCLRHGRAVISTADEEILKYVQEALPEGMHLSHVDRYDYALQSASGHKRCAATGQYLVVNEVVNSLVVLGLQEKKAHEKHIPEIYLLNDPDTRRAILQGLMDTDGSISKTGAMEFSTTSKVLARDVAFLVASLGGKTSTEQRQTHCVSGSYRTPGRISYRVRIRLNECPFRLCRKADRWNPRKNTENRVIHTIKKIDIDHATCISVAHECKTFVTNHGIVTHNTMGGGYELSCHLTGEYPDWWVGRRFNRPIRAWAAGKTSETTRDIVQTALLGPPTTIGATKTFTGTGILPGHAIGGATWKQGVQDLADIVRIRHKPTGQWSRLGFKSYNQGRGSFEGTAQHAILLDEEPPLDIYGECLIRTATTRGIIMLTFTPLEGMSEVVLEFMPQNERPEEV